ncbi:hypothetical protein Kpol_1002p45 [Vanderwaltozyma polyspora DSM 70294]|uniref:Uncharacterized protein n=1 Tax=Vanderwaltozyma polyspora (strain ATCC 22028 / DSM 70294 / BCRC 21397 / CBS 2163 / NBRC 10782 / NRRL Y-8283 / UCD 57-17) TaxID=436907 RepID=A7TE76_VANPO|nr:uncharacterized protein Kpol_1002p45 [Vanderwaltozyma polyspora DSM 70294]EDO19398.1 hypothetical protein Kpol_1002p45 [Vanderwaltozyma polyspora DSM 70294]
MTEEELLPHRRRATTKRVNYSEKDADAELLKRLKYHESDGKKPRDHSNKGNGANKDSATTLKSRNKYKNGNSSGSGSNGNSSRQNQDKKKYQKFLNEKNNWNFIPTLPTVSRKTSRFSHILDFDDALVDIKHHVVYNDESTLLKQNETIYMVSEPPGEPYYVGRVMEFVCKPEFRKKIELASENITIFPAKYFQVRMNWFYRSRDIQESSNNSDPRLLYASLQNDLCPLYSFRGRCTVLHISDMPDIETERDELLTKPNIFYFEQLFDRYTLKYYNTWDIEKLSKKYKNSSYLKMLTRIYRYVYTEEKFPFEQVLERYVVDTKTESKSLDYSWDDTCFQCHEWCSPSQSIKCDDCGISIHLFCMDPPRDRKPNKGIIWICQSCISIQDNLKDAIKEKEEQTQENLKNINIAKEKLSAKSNLIMAKDKNTFPHNSWFQYLGEHMVTHWEDNLYREINLPCPFKCSRTGPKYQWSQCLDVSPWKPEPYSNDTAANQRGLDDKENVLWKLDKAKITEKELDTYVSQCKRFFPPRLKMQPESVNFLDMIMEILMNNDYNINKSLGDCENLLTRESLREPTFSAAEIKKFEAAVKEHGSELHPVCKEVGSQPMSMIVRFYYYWKKTSNGRKIWGNFKGRSKNKNKNKNKNNEKNKDTDGEGSSINGDKYKQTRIRKPSRIVLENQKSNPEIELKYIDDSSFETENLSSLKSCFKCLYCSIDYSPMWYRVTGGSEDDNINTRMKTGVNEKTESSTKGVHTTHTLSETNDRLEALCIRCARLWRRYAIRWDNPINVLKRIHGSSNNNVQKFLDEIFDEETVGTFTTTPVLSREKNIEWELIQDSELIVKQRSEVIQNSDRLARLKKNALNSHSQLYKAARKECDKNAFKFDIMDSELNVYIDKLVKPKQVQKAAITSKISVAKKRKLENDELQERKDQKLLKSSRENTPRCDPDKLKYIKELDARYEKRICNNGSLEIRLSPDGKSSNYFTMDTENNTIQCGDELLKNLLSFVSRHVQKQVISKENIKVLKQEKGIIVEKLESNSIIRKTIDNNRIPIVSSDNDSSKLLRAYHKDNFSLPKKHYNIHIESLKVENLCSSDKDSITSQTTSNKTINSGCNVCSTQDTTMSNSLIRCSNCTLQVHASCYGIEVPIEVRSSQPLLNFRWLCDPCSNELNPIATTNYNCVVCNGCEGTTDFQKPQECGTKNALKITSHGTWCHIICALFNDEVKFGNPKSLQPIQNVSLVSKTIRRPCSLCLKPVGHLTACELCDNIFHISCAQNEKEFSLFFKKRIPTEYEVKTNRFITDKVTNENYSLKPTVICNAHKDTLLPSCYLPLTGTTNFGSKTILNLYISCYKTSDYRSFIYSRYMEQKRYLSGNTPEIEYDNDESINMKTQYLEEEAEAQVVNRTKCRVCSSTRSVIWYDNNLCHPCHLRGSSKKSKMQFSNKFSDINKPNLTFGGGVSSEFKALLLEGIEVPSVKDSNLSKAILGKVIKNQNIIKKEEHC